MEEENTVVFQCAYCDFKFKKSVDWLEKKDHLQCMCGEMLDVDELLLDVYNHPRKQRFTIYQM